MKLKRILLLIIIVELLFIAHLLSGCATKRYVDGQCWEMRRQAREYTRDRIEAENETR